LDKGIAICLTGANVAQTAAILAARIEGLGRLVAVIDQAAVDRFGSPKQAGQGCGYLSRRRVVVVVVHAAVQPTGESLDIEIDANDTPDFAAEKVLDALAAAGVIAPETLACSPDEEELIRQRLADLGYIE